MSESPLSDAPAGIEWLPALGGARLLRTAAGPGDPPALILRTAAGEEHRIEAGPEARFSRHTDYLVPAGVSWSAAFLQWPDGTRAIIPSSVGPRADVIAFRRPDARLVAAATLGAAWTAPPSADEDDTVASLRADLRAARAAREADRAALGALAGELDAERTAHAVTRGTLAAERSAHATTRGSLAALATTLATERGAHAVTRVSLSDALSAARADLEATRATSQAGEDARVHLTSARRDTAVARAEAAALRAELDAARAAVAMPRAGEAPAPAVVDAERLVADLAAAADALRERAPVMPAPPAPAPPPPEPAGQRWLRQALVALAREDPRAAGALIAGLLPATPAAVAGAPEYDVTIRGVGTFAVSARQTRPIPPRRWPRADAAFHVDADPLALAQLLAGERKLRRFSRAARVHGRRRARVFAAALPASSLSLAEALSDGARIEPRLLYRALPFAVPPEWTRGHVFTVANEIVELAPRAWYVIARDGVRLDVVEHVAGACADATVTMSRAAFERYLRGEPALPGDRPTIRGDRAAVAALKQWTDRARGV